ncbi:MAG TPA: hypothetical protein VF750_09065, partial [Sphingomicrobium sp.]
MRASLRWKSLLLGGIMLVPGASLAQSAPDAAQSGTPATDAVGPQELQNFSLPGNVTKPADQPATAAPTATAPAATNAPAEATRPAPAPLRRAPAQREPARQAAAVAAPTAQPPAA